MQRADSRCVCGECKTKQNYAEFCTAFAPSQPAETVGRAGSHLQNGRVLHRSTGTPVYGTKLNSCTHQYFSFVRSDTVDAKPSVARRIRGFASSVARCQCKTLPSDNEMTPVVRGKEHPSEQAALRSGFGAERFEADWLLGTPVCQRFS